MNICGTAGFLLLSLITTAPNFIDSITMKDYQIQWKDIKLWDSNIVLEKKGYKQFIINSEPLPIKRLIQLGKVKNVLVLADRSKFQ